MRLPGGQASRKTDGETAIKKPGIRLKTASNPPSEPKAALGALERPVIRLDVQQILAGEFGLIGVEGKTRLGLGAHQPFDGIGGYLSGFGHDDLPAQCGAGRARGAVLK